MIFKSRAPPPSGAPPSYAFVNRFYRRNLRPVVLATAIMSSIWTLLWAITSFRDINTDKSENQNKLATISLVLGIMYISACAATSLGVIAAVTQRIPLVRMYTFAAALAVLDVIGAGLLRTVIHFTQKKNLIDECTKLSTGEEVTFRFGIWGPRSSTTLSPQDAADWCQNAWSHDSFSEIISVLIEIAFGILFTLVAFSYYRQLLDPTSPANAFRAPSRSNAFPSSYNPPYNAGFDGAARGYDASYPYPLSGQFAPPAGAPPKSVSDEFVPPYESNGNLPGYGMDKSPSYMERDAKGGDPFADFDGPTQMERERQLTGSNR